MKKLLCILMISIAIFSCKKEGEKSYPECILAGQTSGAGVNYTDILPDDTISPINSSALDYLVDLNHDGIDDFDLHAYFFQAPGFGTSIRTIMPLNNNEYVFADADTTLVDTLVMNVSINSNMKWTKEEGTLYSTAWDMQTPVFTSYGMWKNVSDKVVGVRIFVGDKILYGWIKLRVIDGAIFVVYDYACTKES
jgi:hypothetical protein